jgi:hypothetical protein
VPWRPLEGLMRALTGAYRLAASTRTWTARWGEAAVCRDYRFRRSEASPRVRAFISITPAPVAAVGGKVVCRHRYRTGLV